MTLAILLAAGRGRRLGQDKALLELGGRTALERCLSALSAGGADALVAVLAPGADRAEVQARASGAAVVINPEPERGQSSSLRCALQAGLAAHEAFLVHTVDHPLVEATDVAALLAAFGDRQPHQQIVAPSVDGRRGHPTVFAAALVAEFLALGPGEPGHLVVRRDPGRVLHVPLENPWLIRDIDTPGDLETARADLARRST